MKLNLSTVFDNFTTRPAADFLRDRIRPGADLSIVSAYFTIFAYDKLKDKLSEPRRTRFLFGDPSSVRSLDPSMTESKSFLITESGLSLSNRLQQKRAARECADWIRRSVNVRSMRQSNLLHGKMYHVAADGRHATLVGSSNFTVNGLGLAGSSNIELNVQVANEGDCSELLAWFEAVWNDPVLVKDVKDEVLLYLEQLYTNQAPEFIYYKTLFHLFKRYLEEGTIRGLEDPKLIVDCAIWQTLFQFQKDGVKAAINKINSHNGCILADSVGLGKTYEALAIIKYFELRNARCLVLCPKKLRENWTVYLGTNNSELNPFLVDRFSYTVLSHTDLSRDIGIVGDINLETINWGNYDLVVIDESHNFRNNARGRRDEEGNIVRRTRYERLIEDIIAKGIQTKVLLISATPVNNTLTDLRNQLYLISADNDRAFEPTTGIGSLKDTLATAQRTFTEWAGDGKHSDRRDVSALLEKLSAAFFTLLDSLTIARSRKHIEKYYSEERERIGTFPERKKPLSLSPDIDTRGRFMSYDDLNDEIGRYRLSLFKPSAYLLPGLEAEYPQSVIRNFTQAQREDFLIGMMKVNFLKRLESSVHSFQKTMQRTVEKIEDLEEKIRLFEQRRQPTLIDLEEITPTEPDGDEPVEAFEVGKLKYNLAHLRVDDWKRDLANDKRQLHRLALSARDVTPDRDAKLQELKRLITEKVNSPTTDNDGTPNRKVIVFTAFADTAGYLYENLQPWVREELGTHVAMVAGSGDNHSTFGRTDYSHILANFAPRAKNRDKMKGMPQDGEIDLLIATDCISEGQNLQDCDLVVNYDVHWNPVRLIQRFGRIDRIGSRNPAIQMVNFWPTPDLNRYINLKNRVEARMALVDLAATSQDDILNGDQIRGLIQDELSYRDRQLLRLKEEVLDLEDFNDSVALTEFTLDDFRLELMRYMEANREKLEKAPLGLYAVVPPHPENAVVGPGVIFCLKQKGDSRGTESVNPLQPHFLVYVRERGEVRYNYAQAKQILLAFGQLCKGKEDAVQALCDLFDRRTADGDDMALYSDLLQKAVAAIVSAFRKRAAGLLTGSRTAILPESGSQVSAEGDFELITWLVIPETK